jgi:hypothetical protein
MLDLSAESGNCRTFGQADLDSNFEFVGTCVAEINHDGIPDLVFANGGNEFYGNDEQLRPRIYLNDGKGTFTRDPSAFENLFVNASSIVSTDINGDGFADLFIGARSVPFNYGQIPRSYLLLNDGHGKFQDLTDKLAPGLSNIGFITSAVWFDINHDGQNDLIVSLEWGGIESYINHGGSFEKKSSPIKSWWNFILPVDLNYDG